VLFLVISANLWDTAIAMWSAELQSEKVFSYNKRTMDRAMGPFLAVVAVPEISNLRVIDTPNSSTPGASTNN